ncbi:phosphatase PAP2 family protein [Streptomyces sp. NPDC052101]|uniref:phosphatase PAP2 family protein n=1 Tax=Streptomyces sp. NPDC052101 TaxID=3155763 RepID=UPI003446116D
MTRTDFPSPFPFSRRRLMAAVGAAVALGAMLSLFVMVADLLAERHAGLIDRTVLGEAVEHRSPALTWFMQGVSTAAEVPLLALLVLAALGLAWRGRTWRPLVLGAAATGLSVLLATLVKNVAARTRPPVATAVVHETGYSFPSRHTTVATALLFILAYLLARHIRSRLAAVALWVGAAGLAWLVAASRVYLGVHWSTDVTAGFALGAAATLTLVTLDQGRHLLTRDPSRPAA